MRSTPDAPTAHGGTRPIPRCVLDRSRPCNACVADSPATCPYPYLLSETQAA